jgi:hypothetical protein
MTPEQEIKHLRQTIERNRKYWIRAAEKALDGDMRELWTRVQMCKAEPLEIVLSVDNTEEQSGD